MVRVLAFSLAALLAATAVVPPARASAQSNSRQGCMNQWLFNGVWRAKITKVEPIADGSKQTGWRVTEVWRNGTSRELSPADSNLLPERLALSGADLEAEGHSQESLFNTLAPSGEFTYTQTFYGPNMTVDPANKPKALDIAFDGKAVAAGNKPHFTSRQYNFHYDLTCVASAAKAQAEGGSAQLAATQGCMNQWLSNGVWKMRVLAVAPYPAGAAAKDQIGWTVRQEWVNVTHGKVYPGALPDVPNRVAPTNVSDEFLATKSGSNASTANTVGGFHIGQRNVPFAPGVPYAFDQLIMWSPLNPADTPTRLLVTFDTATQKKVKLPYAVPQYRMPANFRISLACGGTVTMAPGADAQQPATPAQPAAAQAARAGSNTNLDPCGMLGAPDVASALGVGVSSLGTAQHPSPNECTWAVASHAGTPARTVVLTMQPVQAAKTCRGLGCLHIVQSVIGIPGVPNLPPALSEAFTDAQIVSDLGDKAAWKDGKLTVVKADMAFQLLVQGSRSPTLATSEALARTVLYHLSSP